MIPPTKTKQIINLHMNNKENNLHGNHAKGLSMIYLAKTHAL